MTVTPQELGTGLDLIERKREGHPAPVACCPRCEEPTPLIATMAFSGAEFYCLECGGRFGFLSPRGVEPTPELVARSEALTAEWDEHAGRKLLTSGAWHRDCEACAPRREPHTDHATDAEKDAHDEAMVWLAERAQ